MGKAEEIKSSCLIAFIHSRIIGLGKSEDQEFVSVFKDDKLSEKAIYAGKYYQNKLEKIATFQKIQNILSKSRNRQLCEMYYKGYKSLEKIFDKHAPVGTDIVEGLIGLNLLSLYAEKWNYHKLSIDFERLTSYMVLYESESTNKAIFKKMAKLAENIYEDYIK
jgi:hypothetical protein